MKRNQHYWMSRWLVLQAEFWLMWRQPKQALRAYSKLLRLDPRHIAALSWLAIYHSSQRRFVKARYYQEELVRLTPEGASAWFNLGFIQQQQNDHYGALESFQRALALNATLDRAWYGQALSLVAIGRADAAMMALEQNIKLQPLSPHGYYQLGLLQARLGEQEGLTTTVAELKRFNPQFAHRLSHEIQQNYI